MVRIGFGSNKKTRYLLPNYKLKYVIENMNDLECLLMNNDKYCAEIGHKVGAALRLKMIKRAKELHVEITNSKSKNNENDRIRTKKERDWKAEGRIK